MSKNMRITVDDLDAILKNNSSEKILAWMNSDNELLKSVEDDKESNYYNSKIMFNFAYAKNYREITGNKIRSYLKWKISNTIWLTTRSGLKQCPNLCTTSSTITEEFSPLIEKPNINPEHAILRENSINSDKITQLLHAIGVNKTISSFETKTLYSILLKLPEIDKEGKKARTLYHELATNYEERNLDTSVIEYITFKDKGQVFCKKDGKYSYQKINGVFYVSNKGYGESIINRFHTIDIVRRKSQDKIEKVFGVKPLRGLQISLANDPILHELNNKFEQEIENFKPYVYVFRQDFDQRNTERNLIKEIRIKLVTDLVALLKADNENIQFDLSSYDYLYLPITKTIYVSTPPDILDERQLKDDVIFCSTVAEAFSALIDVDAQSSKIRELFSKNAVNRDQIIQYDLDDPNLDKLLKAKEALGGIISEKHSGFKDHSELVFGKDATVQYRIDRRKFYNLVHFLSKGYFKGVVVLCWDRVSRNKGDNTIIEKLMKQGVDFRFTLASYDKTSSGALHMDIDGMFAQHHSRVTSEKVTLTMRNQRENGICTYKAPVGYLNQGSMEDKPFDPVRAPIIKQLFEIYATSEWSLADAAKWANSQGMDMPPVRRRRTEEEILAEEEDELLLEVEAVTRPVTYNNVHKILTNRFYTGRILGNDGTYVLSASHKPLVSDELFAKVQSALHKNNVSIHYMNMLKSQYRGLVHCSYCNRIYTPYKKKGIMYYGARCTKNCPNQKKNVNISFIEKSVAVLIGNFRFTESELKELDERTQTDVSNFERIRVKEISVIDRKKRKIREDLTYLRDNKLALLRAGLYTPDEYIEEEEKLNFELTKLQDNEQISDVSMLEVIKDVIELSELLKTLCFCYENAIFNEKEEITRKLFSELLLSEKGLEYKVKTGLEALNTRFIPMGDPTGWISELFHTRKKISQTIHQIKSIIK